MTTPLLRHRNAFFALEMARSTRDTVERSSPGTPAAARCEEELGATQKLYEKTAPDPRTIDDLISLAELAVELDSTPQSEDLAAPPETPQMVRGSDGRLRPVQSAQGDSTP